MTPDSPLVAETSPQPPAAPPPLMERAAITLPPLPGRAWLLGVGGLIPFVGLTAAMVTASPDYWPELSHAQALYAIAIWSFVGAIQWGLALGVAGLEDQQRSRLLTASVLPSLLAWACGLLLLLPDPGFALLALAVVGPLGLREDFRLRRSGIEVPTGWLLMRSLLTSLASLSLLTAGVFQLLGGAPSAGL